MSHKNATLFHYSRPYEVVNALADSVVNIDMGQLAGPPIQNGRIFGYTNRYENPNFQGLIRFHHDAPDNYFQWYPKEPARLTMYDYVTFFKESLN